MLSPRKRMLGRHRPAVDEGRDSWVEAHQRDRPEGRHRRRARPRDGRAFGGTPPDLESYNRAVREGFDPETGKRAFAQTISEPPFYYGKERIYVHTSLDG